MVGCSYSSALIQDVRDHLADTVEHAAEELAGKNHEDLIVILSEWIIEEPIRFTSEASWWNKLIEARNSRKKAISTLQKGLFLL